MVYNTLKPAANDNLNVSQGDIQGNFLTANTVMAVNHYAFDVVSGNQGKHNVVTTPIVVNAPPDGLPPSTISDEPKFYAFKPTQVGSTLPIGTIQFSRGPSDAVPTPVTYLQSSSSAITLAASATTNVVDMTGLTVFLGILQGSYTNGLGKFSISQPIFWTPSSFNTFATGSTLIASNSGNILQLKNNTAIAMNNVYWTLQILRVA